MKKEEITYLLYRLKREQREGRLTFQQARSIKGQILSHKLEFKEAVRNIISSMAKTEERQSEDNKSRYLKKAK